MHFKVTLKKFCVRSQKPDEPKMSNRGGQTLTDYEERILGDALLTVKWKAERFFLVGAVRFK